MPVPPVTKFYIKQGDTLPPILAILKDGTDAVLDLTAATEVKLLLRGPGGDFERTMEIEDPPLAGRVRYDLTLEDWTPLVEGDPALRAGSYRAEFQVTYPEGVLTIPTRGHMSLEITEALDEAVS